MKGFEEYKDWYPEVNLGTIGFFILIKIYMLLTVLAWFVLMNTQKDITISGQGIVNMMGLTFKITMIELLLVVYGLLSGPIYNLIVWIKKKKTNKQTFIYE